MNKIRRTKITPSNVPSALFQNNYNSFHAKREKWISANRLTGYLLDFQGDPDGNCKRSAGELRIIKLRNWTRIRTEAWSWLLKFSPHGLQAHSNLARWKGQFPSSERSTSWICYRSPKNDLVYPVHIALPIFVDTMGNILEGVNHNRLLPLVKLVGSLPER